MTSLRTLPAVLGLLAAALLAPPEPRAGETNAVPAPQAAEFPFAREPLHPEFWPDWNAQVNRDRVFDFYSKQAAYFRTNVPRPELIAEYVGLDGGKYGHWGNQNEDVWKDGRWNKTDLGPVISGVVRGGGRTIVKGVCVRLGEHGELAACFDPATLAYPIVWTNGFVHFTDHRHGINGSVDIDGGLVAGAEAGKPATNFVYHGFYRHGRRTIFAYRRDGVEWLDAPWAENGRFVREAGPAAEHPLAALTKGGPTQWPDVVETKGSIGRTRPYAVDTIALPFKNPWNALMFVGDHDFLPNGDGVICTVMGEVWVVSGIDGRLAKLRWRRAATGLHQPLGLKVVDGAICVQGRDQITRLHDFNGDGEADFYECVANCMKTSAGSHDFSTGLERDAAGNWYFVSAVEGLCRISPDGSRLETLATGFRNANGLALGADGTLTTSCQEGDWTGASQYCLLRPGESGNHFGYRGPRPDRPNTPPLIYLPRGVDNSSGGQSFVEGDRWGVPRDSLVCLSHGAGVALLVLPEVVDGISQAAAVEIPGEFRSGAHRGRFNPRDGQLYVSGCQGWGTYTVDDGCFQRLRFTGGPVRLPVAYHAHDNGVLLRFQEKLKKAGAERPANHFAQVWNYRYAAAYGSPEFSLRFAKTAGHDPVEITGAHVLSDGKTLFVEMPQLQPANQLHLHLNVGFDGPVDVYATVHKLGPVFTNFAGYRAVAKTSHPVPQPTEILPERNPWIKGEPGRAIRVETATGMKFATTHFAVKAGERISLTLANTDVMPHNLAIAKPGTLAKVGDGANKMATRVDGAARHYIPGGGDVLCYTDVIPPAATFTIHFTAPAAPGDYPFLCTFPGHWALMNGIMKVE